MTSGPERRPALKVRVADSLRRDIRAGRYAVESELPTVRALAAEAGVSEGTVKSAQEILKREGVLYGQQGKGVYVGSVPGDDGTGADGETPGAGRDSGGLAERVFELEHQISDLARQPPADAAVREELTRLAGKVGSLEQALTNLYQKSGFDYPHGGAHEDDNTQRNPRNRSARASG